MSSTNLDNLVKKGLLKAEPTEQSELSGLLQLGKARFKDAGNSTLAVESRFDLAYNAAHSLALAALRCKGYRSTNRYIIFQVLPHTADLGSEVWRVLAKCHERRNAAEYEGYLEIDDRLLSDLMVATQTLLDRVSHLIE